MLVILLFRKNSKLSSSSFNVTLCTVMTVLSLSVLEEQVHVQLVVISALDAL